MKKISLLSLVTLVTSATLLPTSFAQAATSSDIKGTVSVEADKTNGTLSLVDVDPSIDFGVLTLDNSQAESSKTAEAPFKLGVTDTRGTGIGWDLQVAYKLKDGAQDPWTSTTEGNSDTISGAKLTISSNDTAWSEASINDATKAPAGNGDITVSTSPATVYTAAAGKGVGHWTGQTGADKLSLSIPSAITLAGEYTATVEWSLLDAPTK